MRKQFFRLTIFPGLLFYSALSLASPSQAEDGPQETALGRVEIFTVPRDGDYRLRSATYTPSGKVLLAYKERDHPSPRHISLAIMEDDGSEFRPFFSMDIPDPGKDNGIRYMVFADNRRIFLGDFIVECVPDIDRCERSRLLPVAYPEEVAGGEHVAHRWSEMIVAPDNEHIAWTTLFANYSAAIFTGRLQREQGGYRIVSPRMINLVDAFRPDPEHPGAVIPNPVRNGEVKQFVHGGTAISMVGAKSRDTADSVVLDLLSGDIVQVTDTPGYNETTIFSPDERLGILMSPRFSTASDLAILGLMPRPHADSLNMGLNMHAYTHAVTGVRKSRRGNVGPVLIDIQASMASADYRGVNLNTEEDWVYYSPMSWHPGGTRAMWLEGQRGEGSRGDVNLRIRVVDLLDYVPATPVPARSTPDDIPGATSDLSLLNSYRRQGRDIDVKVQGRHSGHIEYRRTATGTIEKHYVDFSNDGEAVYSGSETVKLNPRGYSTYAAKIRLAGPKPGTMDLVMTFGPLGGPLPAELIFDPEDADIPATRGYAEYDGRRLSVDELIP